MSELDQNQKFGTFKAVFTPSLLTILGVIMYQRLGWVVGNGGLMMSLFIIALAHVISITTGLSIASIATNRTVRAGGNYYIISRSLGPAIGGAIGIAFYLALTISIALYLIGFAENFNGVLGLPTGIWAIRATALVALGLLTWVTIASTSLALKSQYVVMLAIGLSIISLILGGSIDHTLTPVLAEPQGVDQFNPFFTLFIPAQKSLITGLKETFPPFMKFFMIKSTSEGSFAVLFAVFFPAVSGFTAGVAMSGDLKDPRKSIPLGTIAAIFVGMVVYIALAIYLSMTYDKETLEDPMLWSNVGRYPWMIAAGVWGATISSAIGCILGGPRTLQALAFDRVVPSIFGRGRGPLNEPTTALFISVAIAALAIILGELNVIASILSMGFLTVYAFINLSYGLERWAHNPSFRPAFNVSHKVSFIGAIAAFLVMFKLDMISMIAATLFMGIIYIYLKRKQLHISSGDTWEGVWSAIVRYALLKLKSGQNHGRNWRPNMIIAGGIPSERKYLIDLGEWIVADRGLLTYFYLIKGEIQEQVDYIKPLKYKTEAYLEQNYSNILVKLEICKDIYHGVRMASQSYGVSVMETNTVLLGWPTKEKKSTSFGNLLRDLIFLDKNVLLLKHDNVAGFGKYQTIDIWWGGLEHNGTLMLILAGMLLGKSPWQRATIRILIITRENECIEKVRRELDLTIDHARIKATPVVLKRKPDESFLGIINEKSAQTDLVLMGLRQPEADDSLFINQINHTVKNLKSVLFVKASHFFDNSPQILINDEEQVVLDVNREERVIIPPALDVSIELDTPAQPDSGKDTQQ